MSNTVDITLVDGWNLIAIANTTGTVGIKGSGAVLLNEQNVAPDIDSIVGHRLTENHPALGFFLKDGQALYAKAVNGNFIVSVTLD